MKRVTCDICHAADPTGALVVIQSNIISKTDEEDMRHLGLAMLGHMQASHEKNLRGIANSSTIINGLLVLRHFSSTDESYNKEREIMRDQASEAIMLGAIEEDEEMEEYVDTNGITHSQDCECNHCLADADEEDDDIDEDEEDEDDDEENDGEEDTIG